MDNDNSVVTVIDPQHSRNVPQNPKTVDKRTLRERDEKQYLIYQKARKLRFVERRNQMKKQLHRPGARALRCKRCGLKASEIAGAQCNKKKS
jgi:hypothetical protein